MIVRAVRALLCVRSGAPVPFVRALPPPLGGARTHERTRTGAKRKGPGTWPGPSCLVDGFDRSHGWVSQSAGSSESSIDSHTASSASDSGGSNNAP
jgi:hypothetical protein